MPAPVCNKCKQGECEPGDSWCIACSSLELGQGLFKQHWNWKGVRRAAEEAVLSSARLVKAFKNLDSGLRQETAGSEPGAVSKAAAPAPRSRSPALERRPPLERRPALPRPPSPPPRSKRSPQKEVDYEESFEEESEEEEDLREDGYIERDPSPPAVKEEGAAGTVKPGSLAPPEPAGPPPSRRDYDHRQGRGHHHREERGSARGSEKKKKKKKRRGGTKHQKHWREVEDPLRRSHRPLRGDRTALASSFREGIERRA